MTRRRLAILAAALLVSAVAAALLLGRGHGHRPQAQPMQTGRSRRHVTRPSPPAFSWPVYGFDAARTHSAPLRLRPPFRTLWRVYGDSSFIEFPPVLAAGRLFFGTNHGLVLAVEAASGRIAWHRQFAGCIAASPAVGNGVVYIGFMDPPPCRGSAPSFLAALDARNGRTLWRFRAGVIEAPPLLAGGRVYFGSWDHRIYALDARTGRLKWSFSTGDRVKGGVALAGRTVFAGSYDGYLYALDARGGASSLDGRGRTARRPLRNALRGSRPHCCRLDEPPCVRVLDRERRSAVVGPNGELRLLRLRRLPARPRTSDPTTIASTHSGRQPAALAGRSTPERRSQEPRRSSDGLVYFSTCGSCSSYESNPRARRTFALDAATGRLVWRFPDGEYSPVIADRERLYLTGSRRSTGSPLQTGANLEVERHGPGGPAGLQNRCRSTWEPLVPPCAPSLRTATQLERFQEPSMHRLLRMVLAQ